METKFTTLVRVARQVEILFFFSNQENSWEIMLCPYLYQHQAED